MFIHYRTLAFALGSKETGESDRIIYFYTEKYGFLEILGKAIRKVSSKLKYGVQDFCFSEIEFIQGKRFKILTDVYLVKNPDAIKKDLEKLKTAYAITDLVLVFVKQPERDERLWNLLQACLRSVGAWKKNYFLIYQFFFWNFMEILGFGLDFSRCPICQRRIERSLNFIFTKKGFICSICRSKIKKKNPLMVREEGLKILRVVQRKNLRLLSRLKFNPELIKDLKKISNYYLRFVQKEVLR